VVGDEACLLPARERERESVCVCVLSRAPLMALIAGGNTRSGVNRREAIVGKW
jgi:hypothetical protein